MFVRNIILGCSIENFTPVTYLDKVRLRVDSDPSAFSGCTSGGGVVRVYECLRPEDEKMVVCSINEVIRKIEGRFCALDRQDIQSKYFQAITEKMEVDSDKDLCIRFRYEGRMFLVSTQFFSKEIPGETRL